MKQTLLFLIFTLVFKISFSQDQRQFFEGNDNNLVISIDSTADNIWQVGRPQKVLFDSAATVPNAIVTDTINTYPINNTSIFSIEITPYGLGSSYIQALQWMQKLDMEQGIDGGLVEFSVNGGAWENMLTSPFVYNQYGYDSTNIDTLINGQLGFTGTDSTWRNIWLCFDGSFFNQDTIDVRFTFVSDSNNTNQEGWIMDNFIVQETWVHTLEEAQAKQEELIKVYPTVTTGRVNVVLKHLIEEHYVENMKLVDYNGKVIKDYGRIPSRFFIDMGGLNSGQYFLQVKTNLDSKTLPITLTK